MLLCLLLGIACGAQTDATEIKLLRYKEMFSKGLISANDYELLRKQTLGIKEMASWHIHDGSVECERRIRGQWD